MIIFALTSLLLGVLGGYILRKSIIEKQLGLSKNEAQKILEQSEIQAQAKKREIVLEGKDEVFKFRQETEKEIAERRKDLHLQEKRIRQKEESVDRRVESTENKEKAINEKIKDLERKVREAEEIKRAQLKKLEEISTLTLEQAKKVVIDLLQENLVHERGTKISEYEQNLKEEKEKIARNILTLAVQRYAAGHIAEIAISVVQLPNDDIKGRLIGREGRNIRAIENLTGVNLIIDDTPETVSVSAFDPMRREIACKTINYLIADGRIHPAKIEEMLQRATEKIEKEIKEEGQAAVLEAGVLGIHPDIVRLLGRLKYRTSYGQNILRHSFEVSQICGFLASELGIDVPLAKRCGLLHDIGKAMTHDSEGSHVELGVEIATKYKENKTVIEAIAHHHETSSNHNFFTLLVQAADAVSAARPGARREDLENYVKRLQKLETLVSEFEGVEKCYAIQAGREVRVMISPEKINDDQMKILAHDICQKIESDLSYPGQIKVNLIRESRASDYAR